MRVMLVDDNLDFAQRALDAIDTRTSHVVVGRALSGVEALELLPRVQPDVVLVDLAMPELDGLRLTHRIKQLTSPPRVVVITAHDDPEYREAASVAGADGFVAKHLWSEQLEPVLDALDVARRGGGE